VYIKYTTDNGQYWTQYYINEPFWKVSDYTHSRRAGQQDIETSGDIA